MQIVWIERGNISSEETDATANSGGSINAGTIDDSRVNETCVREIEVQGVGKCLRYDGRVQTYENKLLLSLLYFFFINYI